MTGGPEVRAFVGLGANLGEPQAALRAAIDALGALPRTRLTALSSFYRSAPVQAGGPDFVNAVAELSTALEPEALLAELHRIEAAHGRVRGARNAPRTLDLDLLAWGDAVRRRADGTHRARIPQLRGYRAIARGGAPGYRRERFPDAALEGRAPGGRARCPRP